MQASRLKTILWDPHPNSNQFIVGGSTEIRQYEYNSPTQHSLLASHTDLPSIRTFAWSPDPSTPDLIALGSQTGKAVIFHLSQSTSSFQIPARHSRPCTAIAWSPTHCSRLAIGLEKARGDSLAIWDISKIPRVADQATPVLSLQITETIHSVSFLDDQPVLLGSFANKFVKAFDTRMPDSSMTWSSHALYGLSTNPFNKNQFLGHSLDGLICIYDLRHLNDPLVSFSETDGLRAKKAKGLIQASWDKEKQGIILALDVDSSVVRSWNVVDGKNSMPVVLNDSNSESFPGNVSSFARVPNEASISILGVVKDVNPVSSGYSIHQRSIYPSQSIAFGNGETGIALGGYPTQPPYSESGPVNIFQISDQASDFSSEEESDTEKHKSRGRSRFLSYSSRPEQKERNETPRPGRIVKPLEERSLKSSGSTVGAGSIWKSGLAFTSINSKDADMDGSITPRRLSRLRTESNRASSIASRAESVRANLEGLKKKGMRVLRNDVGLQMQARVLGGYGVNPDVNGGLGDTSLYEFWSWIARCESLNPTESFVHDYDFRYRGVLSILRSFSPLKKHPVSYFTANYSSSDTESEILSPAQEEGGSRDFGRACEEYLRRRKQATAYSGLGEESTEDEMVVKGPLEFPRRVALIACGRDWEEGWSVVCKRLALEDDYESAARMAFFSGQFDLAMFYLKSCTDERIRLVAPVLAAFISWRDRSSSIPDRGFTDMCRMLSTESDTPWIRALFAYIASSDWRELVDETALPLRDRVAVALKFLPDSELVTFLNEIASDSLSSSDLEGVLLFGLRNEGIMLLQNYIDRTGDFQTAALASSFITPGIIPHEPRLNRWIETYRSFLDTLQLYAQRAEFDNARGRRARLAMDQSRLAGRGADTIHIAKELAELTPPQMMVRCHFCGIDVTSKSLVGEERVLGLAGLRGSVCPGCKKSLPGCAVCLEKPSIHSFDPKGHTSLAWCQYCRHGGHASHILEWFESNPTCAVAGCDCRCNNR